MLSKQARCSLLRYAFLTEPDAAHAQWAVPLLPVHLAGEPHLSFPFLRLLPVPALFAPPPGGVRAAWSFRPLQVSTQAQGECIRNPSRKLWGEGHNVCPFCIDCVRVCVFINASSGLTSCRERGGEEKVTVTSNLCGFGSVGGASQHSYLNNSW
jgi:hypothetical protein